MSEINLKPQQKSIDPTILAIDLSGVLDSQSGFNLVTKIQQGMTAPVEKIILNVSELEYLDGGGAAELIKLYAIAHRKRKKVLIHGMKADISKVFRLMGIDEAAPFSGSDSTLPGWSEPVLQINAPRLPSTISVRNLKGRRVTSPVLGFGQLWEKNYIIQIPGVPLSPEELVKIWKENFSDFWPVGNHAYFEPAGVYPGNLAALHLAGPGGMLAPGGNPFIETGILVAYSGDGLFSFLTVRGHMYAGLINFSAFVEDKILTAQVNALLRTSDPLFELGARIGIVHKIEDAFWHQSLKNLAGKFGIHGSVTQVNKIIDPDVQWASANEIWYNAAVRTMLFLLVKPFLWHGNKKP